MGHDYHALDSPFRTVKQEAFARLCWVRFFGMMYYDRSIDTELAAALAPGGPLAWLMAHVRSDMGHRCHAHLEFRKTRSGDRQQDSVQLYWGRTSPLKIQPRRNSCARLYAYKDYRMDSEPSGSKPLFSKSLPFSGGRRLG